jgi:hypothetical protein
VNFLLDTDIGSAHVKGNRDDEQCRREFARLFPPEYWSAAAPGEFAPDGWNRSPLRLEFHPTAEQVYEETVRTHRNLASLRKATETPPPEPTRAEVEANFRETPIDAEREAEIARMRAELDDAYREAVEESRRHPPSATVRAYRAVYSRDPRGWPP